MGECCDADTVLSEALRVLGQTELFKPIGDLLHCRKPLATEPIGSLPQNLTHSVSQGAIQCQEQPCSRHHFRATPPAGVGARGL
jgi:hypothetical protein